jgi:site-specific DNA-cytosine methylase
VKTLILNTYAGSLLLGANAIKGSQVTGSYEDCGFGAQITRANLARFNELDPDFKFIDQIKQWPDQDLSDTVVLAHPPCSAFSQQNTSAAKRGTGSAAFDCTRKVIRYAFANNAAALAVESVMGALGGAWDEHNDLADAGGYHIYRVLKNSILFGVPQYRERFWCLFVRKGLANPSLQLKLSPRFVTIGAVLDPVTPGDCIPGDPNRTVSRFVKYLTTGPCRCGEKMDPPQDIVHGFDEAEVRRVGLEASETELKFKRIGFAKLIQPRFFPTEDSKSVIKRHVSPFTSAQPSVLAPFGYAPVLLGTSLWVYKGAVVTAAGYKAIMGFPTDYIFPHDPAHGVRTFLSKGVCPPVAEWILDSLRQHLGEAQGSPLTNTNGYHKVVEPGKIASFRPSKTDILRKYETMWQLGSPEDDEPIPLRSDDEGDEDQED